MGELKTPEASIDVDELRRAQFPDWSGLISDNIKIEPAGLAVAGLTSPQPSSNDQTTERTYSEVANPVSSPDQSNWTAFAACKGMTTLFYAPSYPERKERRLSRESRAKEICDICRVAQFCLENALANNEIGIWGGMTEDERRLMLTRQQETMRISM